MKNTKYLILIIFIATSTHTSFGMDNQSFLLKFKTLFSPTQNDPEKATSVYAYSADNMYVKILSSGNLSNNQTNVSLLAFNIHPQNYCKITISTKDNSYAIAQNLPEADIYPKNFLLTLQQLDTIKSKITQGYHIIIWHDNQRFDICKIEDNINESIEDQAMQIEKALARYRGLSQQYFNEKQRLSKENESLRCESTAAWTHYNTLQKNIAEEMHLQRQPNTLKKMLCALLISYSVGVTLLLAYDKIMSSFATSVQ